MSAKGPNFVTIRNRPKSGDESPYRSVDLMLPCNPGEIAVIVQGPLLHTDNFTVESLQYYRLLCPEFTLILSTWEDEPAEVLDHVRALGVEVVLSEKPTVGGRNNINFQVTSTIAGLKRAEERGCRYAAKTRADQRLYAIHAVRSLPVLLRLFPSRKAIGQSARLIGTGHVTSKYSPYFLSDFFSFGLLIDVMNYWAMPQDPVALDRHESNVQFWAARSFSRVAEVTAESILLTQFLCRATGKTPQFTVPAWWGTLADRLIVIDWAMLDVYWPKYKPQSERPEVEAETFYNLLGNQVSFADWLALYESGGKGFPGCETMIDLPPHTTPTIRVSELTAQLPGKT